MSSWQRDDALFMERGSSIGESMASAVGSFVMASPIGLSDVAVSPMDPSGRRAMVAGDKADSFSRTREASAQPELEMTVEEVVSPTSSSSSNGSHGGLYGHMMDQSHTSDRGHHRSNASCERARGFSDENELQFGDIDDDDIDSVAGTNDDAVLRNGRLGLVLNVDGDSTQPTLSSSVGTSHGLSSMTRKTSSSFSDLGDFDEVTIPDTTPNGTPITPTFRSFYDGNGSLGRSIYSGMSSGHHVSPAPRGSLVAGGGKAFGRTTPSPRHGVPADEHQPLFGTISPIAGEVVRMEVENAAYIIFYKTEENENDYESGDTEGAQDITDRQEYTRAGACDDEASDDSVSYKPPKTLKSLGDAGHKVRTTNCFTRDYAHPTRSLGRGLFRASTSVGSAFLKGAAGLVNRTYEGGANGGVFGFAKGLGMGMLGLGAHTVKGAFRGVGHVTNVVGEMVMGSAPHFSIDGSLVLTNYRLVWMAQSTPDTLEIPLSTILAIENSASATHVINIECKSLLRFSVAFRDESTSYELLSSVWDLFSSSSYVFAHTHYQALLQNGEKAADDLYTPLFQFYNAEEDYSRLKLFEDGTMKLLDNSQYILYPSYPAEIVVPAELTDEDLQELSSYRSARRIPAVVWRHPHSGAMMTRCAQPCAGLSGYVADADKKFVAAMQRATGGYDSIFHFYDARSQIAAAANSAQGKGTEDTRNYDYTELHHCDIANIHAVRSSFVSLSAVCQPGEDLSSGDWYTQLQNTFWFMHISRILASAHNISETMCRGESVMVHCSDGWDRTPQLTGLVQLLLDPYYRTLSGFLKLIEKEWVSFGHMFRTRYSQGDCPGHQEVEEQSPVFVQWIDAVWQVWRQEPWAFEFNEGLLGALYDNVFSGLYGTFLYNNERERRERELKHPTRSFWSHVIEKRDQYVNIDYDPTNNFKSVGESLRFSFDENALVLWEKHLDHADPVTRKYS